MQRMAPFLCSGVLLSLLVLPAIDGRGSAAEPIRVGVIGLDSYQAVAFASLFQQAKPNEPLAGIEVVVAYPGGSPDIQESVDSLPKWVKSYTEMGIPLVDSIEAIPAQVDAILVMSLDGRTHLEQATFALQAGKPVYIGRPMAASLVDVVELFRRAEKYGTPLFSCSQHRFVPAFQGMKNHPQVGRVLGCSVYGGLSFEASHDDFFWHSIHSAETLFTIMGAGCLSVTRASTPAAELVTGIWRDQRIGTFRGIGRGVVKYSGLVFGEQGILRAGNYGRGVPERKEDPTGEHWFAPAGEYMGYKGVALEIAKFFRTGTPPVSSTETIEIFAFLEAAHESKRQGGIPITIESVIRQAQADAAGRYGD